MIQAKCIQKYRDNQGRIIGYKLKDTNGNIREIHPIPLKNAIKSKQINVINLKLTPDFRLIDNINVTSSNKNNNAKKITKKDYLEISIKKIIKDNLNGNNGNNGESYVKGTEDIILYHGSRDGIIGEIKPSSRPSTDFGKGFYTGNKIEQALAIIRDAGKAKLLYTLYVDINNNTNGNGVNLSTYKFTDIESWVLYIAYNRDKIYNKDSYKKLKALVDDINKYDIIIGKIADDKMFTAFNEFYEMNMTIKGLEYCLSKASLGDQYVFKSTRSCSIIKLGEIRKYNKLTDDIVTNPIRQEMKTIRETIIEDAKIQFRRDGEYIDQILERYK